MKQRELQRFPGDFTGVVKDGKRFFQVWPAGSLPLKKN